MTFDEEFFGYLEQIIFRTYLILALVVALLTIKLSLPTSLIHIRLKAILTIGHRKAFCKQQFPISTV